MRTQKQLSSTPRIWEIDAMRGLLILCVLATHLYYTVDAFCINGIYKIDSYAYVNATDPLHFWFDWGADGKIYKAFLSETFRVTWVRLGVDGFFVLSGISCIFSRDNLKRGIKMLAGAFIIAGFTKLLAIWTRDPTRFIRFGVLHCYAYCHIIYSFLLERKGNWVLWVVAAASLTVGYYLRYNPVFSDSALLFPFGIREDRSAYSDYWPIFPMLGWMLLGVILGRRFYSEKQSLLSNSKIIKMTRPLQWMGRYSGQIYLLHIFIYPAVFYGIGCLFQLF